MEMPSFLKRGETQHTTQEANDSWLVTKIRWVVESANGRLKTRKYLDRVLPNSQVPKIGDHVRIVAAVCNAYRPPLSNGCSDDTELAAKMKYLACQRNALLENIDNDGLDKRMRTWTKMDAEDVAPNFPRLDEMQFREFTLGVYQLRLARSYTHEHFDESGTYEILVHEDVSSCNLLSVKIQSRHISAKKYYCWISYEDGVINSWYCKCKCGSRVVGTCAHVTSVLWYFGLGRFEKRKSGVENWSIYVQDAAVLPIDESEDETERENVEE